MATTLTPAQPIRTVHFTNAWHSASGGIRTFYTALLEHAERDGRAMTLVVPGDSDGILERGRHTRIVAVASPCSPVVDRRYRLVLPHRYLFGRSTIGRLIDEASPDLIEVSDKYTLSFLAGAIKRRAGPRPTVIGLSQERFDDSLRAQIGPGTSTRAFARWYVRSIYLRQFDAHLANSAYTAAELRTAAISRGPRAALHWRMRDRIFVEHPGADVDRFHPGLRSEATRRDLLARMGGGPHSVLIVFAGRLSNEKRIDDLLAALSLLVGRGIDARLLLAGDGPARTRLEHDAVTFVPGRCLVVGHLGDRGTLAEVLACADVFVHPNPREPFGIGPLEAMACGVPVVVPASGGVLAYATAETTWLAGPGPTGLAAAVADRIAKPDEAARRSERAVARARDFSLHGAAARYVRAYEAIHAARLRAWSGHAPPSVPGGEDDCGPQLAAATRLSPCQKSI